MVRVPRQRHVYPTLFQTRLFTVVSMQIRYSSLHTDLPKLLCTSPKKAPLAYTQGLASLGWKLASHHLSMMPEYNERICVTIFKHKQTSRFFLEWCTQLCTLHTLKVSVRIPAFHMSMWLEKLLLQAYYLQLVADIPPFRSWSGPDLWPISLRWLNRYALP